MVPVTIIIIIIPLLFCYPLFHNYSAICKTFSLKMSNSTLTSVDWPNQLVNGLWVFMSQKSVSMFCPDLNVGSIFPVITK